MNKKELTDIVISWLTISFAFSYAGSALGIFLATLPNMLLAVGFGFILHELAHRQISKMYGVDAEYRMWTTGLIAAIGLAVLTAGSFVFAAPGATYVLGPVTRQQNAYIAAAGPAINFVIGIVFFGLAVSFNSSLSTLFSFVSQVNFFLGFFNMLPFPPLDGSKVFTYNVFMWVALIGLNFAGMIWF